ncbi:unnamed protein product [Arctia plantaginis]|uniref:Sodefrin-like factor n=1 Tax=Arctia plantaginis TaxID=874455 RepID=A0A8S1B1K6_ARCPL|nr:unnamed protein product [Arctia plantaginis]
MVKIFYVFTIVAFCAINIVNSQLQCYVCTNCPLPSSNDLQTCGPPTTTTIIPTSELKPPTESSTVPSTEPSTETSTNPFTDSEAKGKKYRRSVGIDSPFNQGCICYNGKCDCSGKYASMYFEKIDAEGFIEGTNSPVFIEETDSPTAVTYQCYTHTHTVDGFNVINRGCKAVPLNETACSVLNAPDNYEVESLPNERDDNETTETEDIDRSGMAQAKAYASVTRIKPGMGMGAGVKFVNCFSCVDCPKVLANTTSKYCPYTNDPTKQNKCVVYAEKYIRKF